MAKCVGSNPRQELGVIGYGPDIKNGSGLLVSLGLGSNY